MSLYTQRGFVPCRHLGGGQAILKTFRVSASTNQAYFPGDAVTLTANGRAKLLTTEGQAVLGVVLSCYKVDGKGNPAPLTFNQPGAGPYLASAQAGFVKVNTSPQQTYIGMIDTNITETSFGAGCLVSAGAPNTAAGLSGQSLQGTVTTSADNHFQIIGFAPVELNSTRTSAASPVLVEVRPVATIFGFADGGQV